MTQPFPNSPYPLDYSVNPPRKSVNRGIFGWVLFIGLAVMLFLLLSRGHVNRQQISLSDFRTLLDNGKISAVTLDGDEITGVMTTQSGAAIAFSTRIPTGTSPNWQFTQWVLEHSGGATVTVNDSSSLLMNILVPLIPWLLIFGFIWFFVFRNLRKQKQAQTTFPPPIPTGTPFAAWVYPYQPSATPPPTGLGGPEAPR
jgi:ATP-dependent Zn protease